MLSKQDENLINALEKKIAFVCFELRFKAFKREGNEKKPQTPADK